MSLFEGEQYSIISMSDVIRHPWYERLKDTDNGLEALLFSMGLDINKDYEIKNCEHRSELTNEVHICDRFSGSLRTDDSWKEIQHLLKN